MSQGRSGATRATGLALLIALGALAAPVAAAPAAPPTPVPPPAPVEILFHADLDGRFAAPACGKHQPASPDYAGLVTNLEVRRAAGLAAGAAPPVVLLGGNWAGPDPLATAVLASGPEGGRTLAALLGRLHYDAIAVGHQELSLEPAVLDALLPTLARAGLPLVATNLTCDARRPACAAVKREILVRRPGAVVGVLATIFPSVIAGIARGRMAGLNLADPLVAIREGAQRLRAAGATRIVVLTDGPRDARALDEIDTLARRLADGAIPYLLLGAGLADDETGRTVLLLRRDGAPPVVGSVANAGGFSVIKMVGADVTNVETMPAAAATRDPEIEQLLAPSVAAACAHAMEPLAPAPVRTSIKRDDFLRYVLEVMRRRTDAEIAVINSAFIKRAPFPVTATFTRGDLERALPYHAVLGVARVQGPVVESVLGAALSNPKLAVVGLTKGPGELQVNGRGLDKARGYRIATIAFVADGGDGIFAARALPFAPLPGAPDLRDEVASFLRHQTAAQDGDPTVNPATDFGRPPADRPLWVALGDVGFDFSDTTVSNRPAYGDAQLTRAQQTSLKGQATLVAQLRHPVHEGDGRFDVQYGWSRNQPAGMPQVSGETADLITAVAVYSYKGLRDWRRVPKPFIPDPYVRSWLESELTRPDVTPTQMRTYHHLQLTNTAGAQLTLAPRLKLRGGAGAQSELLASGPAGKWRAVIEAGATLDPTVLATVGALAVKVEGLIDYDLSNPTETRQHQLRATGRLSVPLVPTLFLTVGLDVFAVQRQELGWGASYDTTIGLRLHTDFARQAQ